MNKRSAPRAYVFGAGGKVLFRDSPLELDEDGSLILAALVAAAGAPVSEATLLAALGAAGRSCDAGLLWSCVAALNGALDGCSPEAGYVAHFPARGFALVVPAEQGKPQTMQRLPTRITSVIGCEDAVERLKLLLPRHRCVTIVAAGGIGKTTLATVLAEAMFATFRDGVCFVDLAPTADPRLLPNVLAAALGVGAGTGAAISGLGAFLREKHMLIVLDSCEHVIGAAASMVEQLLRAAPDLHVLATSREPLRASGEWVYRHGPMRLPATMEGIGAAQAISYPAVQLFAERAQASACGFVLDDANVALVCAICRRLDGIPLAIELAAARVALLGIAGLADQLRHHLLSSVGGRRSSVARHRTLRAMLDWSFDLLPEHEKAALARLALYRGEFTLAAAGALLSDTPDGSAEATGSVLELIAKSLVARRDDNTDCRLRLLDTTRAYAGDKLDARGERPRLLLRHARYLCSLLEVADQDWLLMNRQQWLARYAIWIDDIRIVLDWAFSGDGDALAGILLTSASFSLGHQASFTAEFSEHVKRAIQALDSTTPGERVLGPRLRALISTVNPRHVDEELLQRTLATACEAPPGSALHTNGTALATGWWAIAFAQGDYPAALERAEAIGGRARASADKVIDLISQRTSSQALHFLGRQPQARVLASNVLANAWRKIPLVFNPSPVDVRVSMRIVLARIAWMDGCAEQGQAIAAECLRHAVADTAIALAQTLGLCCVPIALWCGERDEACELIERLALHTERHSLDDWYQWAVRYRDVLAAQQGDVAAALRLAAPAATAFENMQRDHLVTFDPRRLAADSIARVESGMAGWCAPELLRAQAEQLAEGGQMRAAEALLWRSIGLAREQQVHGWELRGVTSLARLWQGQDRGAAARDLLGAMVGRLDEGKGAADQRQARTLLAEL